MVSSALDMELADLRKQLERIHARSKDDPEYKKLRATLPKHWPMCADSLAQLRLPAVLAPLRHRDFRLLLTGQTVSSFGNSISNVGGHMTMTLCPTLRSNSAKAFRMSDRNCASRVRVSMTCRVVSSTSTKDKNTWM